MKATGVLVAIVGLVMAGLGLTGIASPPALIGFAKSLLTTHGLLAVAALRLAIGLLFWFAAPGSRMPRTLRALGILVVISGIATALVGVERATAMLEWFAAQGTGSMRAMSALAAAFGAFIVYVALPRRPA